MRNEVDSCSDGQPKLSSRSTFLEDEGVVLSDIGTERRSRLLDETDNPEQGIFVSPRTSGIGRIPYGFKKGLPG